MRTWVSLAQEAESFQSQVYHWPSAFPKRIQAALESFDRLCVTRLVGLLSSSLSDQSKSIKIRRFFAMRWSVIANTSLDYTLNPALISNSWYLSIATRIASSEEAIIQILMPTIKKVIATGMEDDVRLSTELPDRIIHLNHFILSTNQECLISLDDLFNYARHDTNHLFPVIQIDEAVGAAPSNIKLFPLTASDREAVRQVTPEALDYFDLLKQVHTVSYKVKPSVGFALFELHEALLRSSKIDLGSDVVANIAECQQPIINFHKMWISLLAPEKKKIGACRAAGGSESLYVFLLTLFAHTPGIELSDAEYASVDTHIIPCTHMIGEQLKTLLKHNVDLYNIALPDQLLDFYLDIVPAENELNEAQEKCIRSLFNRQLTLGKDDSQVIYFNPFFEAFTDNLLKSDMIPSQILRIQSEIQTISQLKYAMLLLPERKWDHLLLLMRDKFFFHTVDRDSTVVQGENVAFLSQILKSIPPRSWQSLFDALIAQKYDFFLTGYSLARLLYEFNELQWVDIVRAMGQYPASILVTSGEVARLFAMTNFEHYRIMGELFYASLANVLNTPQDFAELFNATSREIWGPIFSFFSSALLDYIRKQQFIDETLQVLHADRRLSFISLLVASGVTQEEILLNLHYILKQVDARYWREVFQVAHINLDGFYLSSSQFFLLLLHIDVESWRALNSIFQANIRALITPERLGLILKDLPANMMQPFFSTFLTQAFEVSGQYVVNFLTQAKVEDRLTLLKLIFNGLNVLSFQFEYFVTTLNLLPTSDWQAAVILFPQSLLKLFFSTVNAVNQLLKKIPVEKWDDLKALFAPYLDMALRDEASLILVAKELSYDKVPIFFTLISSQVKKMITDLNFIKSILFQVHDETQSFLIAFSIAAEIKKFNVNVAELVSISACAEAMQLSAIVSILFEVLDKEEIARYFKNNVFLSNDCDLSVVESWRLLATNESLKMRVVVRCHVSLAMIFYLVPVSEWPILMNFASHFLKEKMHDIVFFRNVLLFLPSENRLALCAALIPHLDQDDFSFYILCLLFNALPDENWNQFLQLIRMKNPTIVIHDFDELAMMVRRHDVKSLRKWHALLGAQIDALIVRPADLVRLFSLFSEDHWSDVANICQVRTIEQFQKIDFLKNTLYCVKSASRFGFLKAIAPYFDSMPINSAIIIDIFSMTESGCWDGVAKLLDKEILSHAIANESELSFVLHGLRDNQDKFLRVINNYLPLIRCDSPDSLFRLLVSFENCEDLLLNLFKNKLPEVLSRFIAHFMVQDDLRLPIADRQKSLFNFLVMKSLPLLLSVSYFSSVFDSNDNDDVDLLEEIVVEFREIEFETKLGDSKDVFRKKLAAVSLFIQEVEKDSLRDKSESEVVRFVARRRLYLRLIAHFGRHFFHKIPQYAVCLQEPLVPPGIRPNRVAFFPQRLPVPPVPTQLFPRGVLPELNGAATNTVQTGLWLENLFFTPPRPL